MQGFLRPPAVLDQPLLAHRLHRQPPDRLLASRRSPVWTGTGQGLLTRPGRNSPPSGLPRCRTPRTRHEHLAALRDPRLRIDLEHLQPASAPAARRVWRTASGDPPAPLLLGARASAAHRSPGPAPPPRAAASRPEGSRARWGRRASREPRPIRAGTPQCDLAAASLRRLRSRAESRSARSVLAAPLAVRERPRDQKLQAALELLAGDGLRAARARPRSPPAPVADAAARPRRGPAAAHLNPSRPEAIRDRIARQPGEAAQGGDPPPLELVGEVVRPHLKTPTRSSARSASGQELRRRSASGTTAGAGRPRSEQKRPGPAPSWTEAPSPRPACSALPRSSPETGQAACLEERLAGAVRLDRRADPLKPPERLLPEGARHARDPVGSGPARGSARAPLPSSSPPAARATLRLPQLPPRSAAPAPGSGASAAEPRQDPSVRDRGDQPESGDQGARDGHRTYVRIPAAKDQAPLRGLDFHLA